METTEFLLKLCNEIYLAEKLAADEYKREQFGDNLPLEFLIMRKDKVRVELRKENVSHSAPHIHITHSDKIDVSISLVDFSVLAGNIDKKNLKYFLGVLVPKKDKLLEIWNELNEKDNSIEAHKLIGNLGL